jgi:hypothetical protein
LGNMQGRPGAFRRGQERISIVRIPVFIAVGLPWFSRA